MHIGGLVIDPEWLRAGGILIAFALLATIVAFASKRFVGKWIARTHSALDDVVFSAARTLSVWALLLAGAYYAVIDVSTVRKDTVVWPMIGQGFSIAWIALAMGTAIRILNAFARWRVERAAGENPETARDLATRVSFVRKLITAVVICVGVLYILSVAGVDTSPIVAGGAISGVVIGIALQDTLSNVFAGFFLNIDRPVKIGDFIHLDSGQEGFVQEVGWRYTKVRLWANNLLIIPNNKLSQSIITNYNLPASPLSVYIDCGVAYDSDLDEVEKVVIRVAKEIEKTVEGGDPNWEPSVLFKTFGDSSINFTAILRSIGVDSQFRIKHEFIKALHREFNAKGIEIPFPIRTVIMKSPGPAPSES